MPGPPQQGSQTGGNLSPSASVKATAAIEGKRNPFVFAGIIGSAALIVAVGAVMLALHKNTNTAAPAPSPAPITASTPPPVSPQPETTASTQTPVRNPAGSTNQCRSIWACDQDSGYTLKDTTKNGNDATLVSTNATWIKSAKDGHGALRLDGFSYAETHGAVIDTSKSFTATAWVNIAAIDKHYNQTVLSIDGDQISGFYLMLNAMKSPTRFSFTRYFSDHTAPQRAMADGTSVPSTNTWYHLAGVYDADEKTMSLYVDGNLQSTVPDENPWIAAGKTAIGRGFYGGKNVDFVNGMIRDVRLYSSALTGDQIKALAAE